jgi:hypothetical protein
MSEIVRRCRVCKCRSDEVKFVQIKDSKTGRYYTHNICKPCRVEENHESRLRRRARDPGHDSRVTMAWREQNIKKWRRYHREWYKKKRVMEYANYYPQFAF